MKEARCTYCAGTALEPGFLEDRGEGSAGFLLWVEGALERGMFGGAKRFGRPRRVIDAFRCTRCGHLELFTRPERE
ncbi:hypothetical protein ACWCPQ_00380 [Nocardia sp. NPDC001965]